MKFEIKHRWTESILFSIDTTSIKLAVRAAIRARANLTGANLTGANLTGADLTGANLTDANLTFTRDDIWAVLSAAPREVPGLLAAIREGHINGSSYSGSCACLVGTLANCAHVSYDGLPNLMPNSYRPAERFFLAIRPGDTPATNQSSRLAEQWVSEWLENMQQTFATAK